MIGRCENCGHLFYRHLSEVPGDPISASVVGFLPGGLAMISRPASSGSSVSACSCRSGPAAEISGSRCAAVGQRFVAHIRCRFFVGILYYFLGSTQGTIEA